MKKYRVENIIGYFGLFIDEIYEAEDEIEVLDIVMQEIMDNIGNYIDIELKEVGEDEE